ncbi:hypothetical protein RHMOL_Rhmol13G0088400 [Rhododendron molle]|uniref:Uncharacterized protein n=1 Tax=Rhododendron molle TaxID=49168 RepID=A0ACC0L533_RHOML|nr:hypothetical protein RHMOL_Rhmol13G0088400 [Rhododendron molle]
MPEIKPIGPVFHRKLWLCPNNSRIDLYRCGFLGNRFRVLNQEPAQPSRLFTNSVLLRPINNVYRQSRVSKRLDVFDLWGSHGWRASSSSSGGSSSSSSRIHANGSCEQESDSKASSSGGEKSETNTNTNTTAESKGVGSKPSTSSPSEKKKSGKGGWWNGRGGGKGRWQPLIQAQEAGVMLLQLGVAIFVLRLVRPGIPFMGSEPRTPTTYVSVPYSDFLNKINGNRVEKVEVDDFHVVFKLKSEVGGSSVESELGQSSRKLQELDSLFQSVAPTKRILYKTTRPIDIKTPYEKMVENDVEFGSPDYRSGGFFNFAWIALFYVALLAGFLQRFPFSFTQHKTGQLRNHKSGSSGGAKVSEQGEAITFADVAGVDEAKEELEEIVEFLRNPDKYVRLGARPPRGVLLVGLPGTGKTLLAKAVAGEAEVPFISCSASEFVELYVGMGASRVRDLFARAKEVAPSIIFIDEIDAVAKSRDGKFRMASNDEREQTLNQLLTEMDGFDSNSAVIVLGATNRSDVLDPALRRPGRFDRVVMVETPDRTGRESILKVHVSKKELPLGDDVELADIASMTTGFTGADLANLVNEAALLAGRQTKIVVEKIDFIHAVERSIAGIEKKTAKLQGCEKGVVARHEAGHAVVGTAVANLLTGQPRVEKLSILPRSGGTLGFAYTPPTTEDRYLLFVDELRGRLVTLLGGRAAEEFVYAGRVSTGALDDIRRATDMAYKAVAEYGLNPTIGPVSMATLSGGGADESRGVPWGRDQVVFPFSEKEKVDGEELQEWLKLVVAPTELKFFITGKQESLLPLQAAFLGLGGHHWGRSIILANEKLYRWATTLN